MASIVKRNKSFSVVYTSYEGGKKKQRWETYHSYEAALHRKEQIELIQIKQKERLQSNADNLAELLEEYVELCGRAHWSYSTYTNHVALIRNHILPTFGDMRLTEFSPKTIPTPATYCGWKVGNPGPYTGLWSSERISEMLKNETYIGNMVQGRSVKISYKSQKCLRQSPENWVVVEGTHEPIIDPETFQKVLMLVNSRKHTRSRTYDFLLKGLIFCHECGYPMAVINRKNAAGEDRLFFVCRTYQRFTKAGVCTCHSIKEETVNEAVLAKVREVCRAYLNPDRLRPIAEEAVENASKAASCEAEIQALQSKITALTTNLDQMYMDRLSGLLSEEDFQRIYQKVKMDRTVLEDRLKSLQEQAKQPVNTEEKAKALVKQFLDSALTSRELLVSLIERVELTEDKQIIIRFRFRELEAIS